MFWTQLDTLLDSNNLIVDRPKGSAHPRYPAVIYPLNYGYLEGTSAGDGQGVDVWLGSSAGDRRVVGAVTTVDLSKRDVELKLLVNCTDDDIQTVLDFFHGNGMGVYLLRRAV